MKNKIQTFVFIYDDENGDTRAIVSGNRAYLEYTKERMLKNATKQLGNMRPIDVVSIEYTDDY